jgi:hypothetical protein
MKMGGWAPQKLSFSKTISMKNFPLLFLLLPLTAPLFAQQPVLFKSPNELKRTVGEFVTINENETLPERSYSVQAQRLPNGATGTFLMIDEAEKEKGIKSKQSPSSVKFSPNPVTDQLTVTVKNFAGESFRIEVLNLLGVKLHSAEGTTSQVKIDFTGYAAGTYFIRCGIRADWFISRVVKE